MDVHRLPNGLEVEIREIRRDDSDRLRAAHARLSPESRYRRFLGAKPTLSGSDARYLVDVDGYDHFALVATSAAGASPGEIIAVARFVRAVEAPDTAEFAIVVGDEYQRLGLAGELLGRLAKAAVARRISRFRATTLTDNVAIAKLVSRLAAGQVQIRSPGPVTDMLIELPGAARAPGIIAA